MDLSVLELVKCMAGCTLHLDCFWTESAQGVREHMQELYGKISGTERLLSFWDSCLGAMDGPMVYGISDDFLLYYIVLPMPEGAGTLLLGPALLGNAADTFIRHVLAHNCLPESAAAPLQEFYRRIPVVERAVLHTVGRALGTWLYKEKPPVHKVFHAWRSSIPQPSYPDETAQTLTRQLAEQQQQQRRALLNALKAGHRSDAFDLLLSIPTPEKIYSQTPLRSQKDDCILWLARFEDAAAEAGVPAVEIEALHRELLYKIEAVPSETTAQTLLPAMLRKYINAIWDASLPECSRLVQRAAAQIRQRYNTPLQVKDLAKEQGVTAEHLSRTFHQQIGMPITEFIHRERIRYAVKYLDETDLPIRDVALFVGYEDISYFSKMFRRFLHCTPREYRHVAQGQFAPARNRYMAEVNT